MTLLPSLLTDTVVQSDDDDVRAGLYGALRNLCYVSGYHTEDEVREARHRELIEEREVVAVLLRPLNAEGNCDLGDETLASPLPLPQIHPAISGNPETERVGLGFRTLSTRRSAR